MTPLIVAKSSFAELHPYMQHGNMHALVEAMRTERDAWQDEAEMLGAQSMRRA